MNLPKKNNPHIEARLNEKAKRIRAQHAAQWMGKDVDLLSDRLVEGSIEYVTLLRKVQRGIGNIVKIVTGKEIPVIYSSGQQSYTDGKHVVLSATIDAEKLDPMCGVALHESTHCLLSNESLKFLPEMHNRFGDMVKGTKLEKEAIRLGVPLVGPKGDPNDPNNKNNPAFKNAAENGTAIEHVQMVMNVLEDRRIDLWMYQNAPGYRPYYDSMYDEYWHSPKIDAAMKDPKFHEKTVDNYSMFVINMTNGNYDPKVMPGLDDIRKIANLTDKGLSARGDDDKGWKDYRNVIGQTTNDLSRYPSLFRDAVEIVGIMYENSKQVKNPQDQQNQKGGKGEGMDGTAQDLPNMDNGGPTYAEIREAMGKQKKFLNHDTGKAEIKADTKAQLDSMDESKASVVDVQGDFLPKNVKARVIVYRDVTKKIVQTDTFPFKYHRGYHYGSYGNRMSTAGRNPQMEQALTNGIRMGQVLAHRIRVMADEKPLTFNRQEHGRLDKRRVAALGTGATDVFSFTVIEKMKPANIWLDVDFSGSMQGDKECQAMTVAVAIAYAAQKNRNLNVTIAIRDGGHDAAHVAIIYDSRRHQFSRLREILPFLSSSGSTPESLCFEAVRDEMLKMFQNERKYFINFSDGEPGYGFTYKGSHYSYGGDAAAKHTRVLMNEFRQAGIEVLSYYIGHGSQEHPTFRKMYGQDARFVDVSSVTQIANTINRMLMTEQK